MRSCSRRRPSRRRRIPTRRARPTVIAAACLALVALPGCGGGGGDGQRAQALAELPRRVVDDLARRSDVVAERLEANDSCGALAEAETLQEQTIRAVNEGRVPPRYQEELTTAVNSLVGSIECKPPTTVQTGQAEAEGEDEEESEEDGADADGRTGKSSGNGKSNGKGKGKGSGKGNGNGDKKDGGHG